MTRIRIVERTGSTNADLLADRNAAEGDWLIALHQTAGRGRQGRSWVPVEGNFYGSSLVTLRADDPPPQTLSLAAGLALIEAIDVAVPGRQPLLKWPNDVMIGSAKLAGILLERSNERIAVGFGVNLAAAPDLPDRKGASLGGACLPKAFAPLIAGSFARLLEVWRQSDPRRLGQAWLTRAHPIGTRLKIHASSEEVLNGSFDGLEPDGALRLIGDGGTLQLVRAGDVEL